MSGDISKAWGDLSSSREQFLDRMRTCAALSIASVLPPKGHTQYDALPDSFQSLAAFGVNNLKSTMLLTLFPAGIPWNRAALMEGARRKLEQTETGPGEPTAVQIAETQLSMLEQTIMRVVDSSDFRPAAGMVLEHEIVVGSAAMKIEDDYTYTHWRIDQYIVERDARGNVRRAILHDQVHADTLPEAVVEKLKRENAKDIDKHVKSGKLLDMYTEIRFHHGTQKWVQRQEIEGIEVTVTDYGAITPYVFPRWKPVMRHNEGRGLIEEMLGDLRAYDGLNRSLLEGAVGAAMMKVLVDPTGLTKKKQVARSPNLAVLYGRAQDITISQSGKHIDMAVTRNHKNDVEQRIGQAMAIFSAVRRDAERVSVLEVQKTILELEGIFGGVFSTQDRELQSPVLARIVHNMKRDELLPDLDEDEVQYKVTTGVEALSRATESQRKLAAAQQVAQILGPERLNTEGLASEILAGHGVDSRGLIVTDDELAAKMEAARRARMQEQVQAKAVDVIGNAAEAQLTQQ